jgi:hypothetical protein
VQKVERWMIQEVGQGRKRGRCGDRLSSGLGGSGGDLVGDDKGEST